MFDINKASDKQKAIYARLSEVDRVLVDKDYANIDEYSNLLDKPVSRSVAPSVNQKPSLDSVPAKASLRPQETTAAPADGFGIKDIVGLFAPKQYGAAADAGQSVVEGSAAQGGRYARDELPGDIVRAPETYTNRLLSNVEDAVNVPVNFVKKALDLGVDSNDQQPVLQLPKQHLFDAPAEIANTVAAASPIQPFLEKNVYAPLSSAAKANQQEVADYKAKEGIGDMFQGGLRGLQLSIAENPDQLGGLAGALIQKIPHPLAQEVGEGLISVPVARVYLTEYNNAIEAGVPKDEAKARALRQAGIEYATEHVGGHFGASGSKLVTSNWAKITKAVLGEAGEEAAATIGQGGLDTLGGTGATGGSQQLKDFEKQQGFSSPGNAVEQVAYSMASAAAGAGALRSVTAHAETRAEKNQAAWIAGQATAAHLDNLARTNKPSAPEAPTPTPNTIEATPSLIPTPSVKTTVQRQQEELAYQQKQEQDAKVASARAAQLEASGTGDANKQTLAEAGVNIAEQGKGSGEMVNPEAPTEAELSEATKLKEQAAKKKAVADNNAFNKQDKAWLANQAKAKEALAHEAVVNDLPPDHIALGMREWAKNNPRPVKAAAPPVSTSTPVTPVAAPTLAPVSSNTQQEAPTAPQPATTLTAEEAPVVSVADRMRAAVGNPTTTASPAVAETATPEAPASRTLSTPAASANRAEELTSVYKGQFKNMAPKDINAVMDAVTKGHLVVAKTGTVMANGKTLPSTSAGHYDGKTMYINQDHLAKGDNLKDIANHEVEHFFRLASATDHEAITQMFAGRTNLAQDNAAIEKLAATGNKVALKAVASARQAQENDTNNNKDVYSLELPAYFVQHSSEAVREGGVLGSARQTFSDIISSLKENILNKVVPLTENPDYVSRKRLSNTEKAPQAGSNNTGAESKTSGSNDLQSFGGEGALGFEHALRNGAVFIGPDGMQRFHIPDELVAKINLKVFNNLKVGEVVPITDVLDNVMLEKEYPWLKNVTFTKQAHSVLNKGRTNSNVWGTADLDKLHIEVSDAFVNRPLQAGEILMHEVQHIIQTYEGFSAGSNSTEHYDHKMGDRLWTQLATKLVSPSVDGRLMKLVAQQADGGIGYSNIDDMLSEKDNWDERDHSIYKAAKGLVRNAERLVERNGLDNQSMAFMVKYAKELEQLGLFQYNPTAETSTAPWIKEQLKALHALDVDAHTKYEATLGEREARLTQHLWKEAQLGKPPRDGNVAYFKDIEEDGNVIVTEAAGIGPVAAEKFGISKPKQQDDLQSFASEENKTPNKTATTNAGLERVGSIIDSVVKGVTGAVVNLTTTTAGAGRALREIRERALSWPTEYQLVAEANATDLHAEGLSAEAKDPSFSGQALIDRVENTADAAERERILNAASREHPEFVRSYRTFRDSIDHFSDLIILERAKMLDTHPLSKEEEALYSAILDNKGRYTTRTYMLGFGKKGKLYADRTWQGYERTAKGNVKTTAQDRASYTKVAAAMAYLRGELIIPEVLPTDKKRLTQLYSSWFSTKEGDTVASMTEKLEALRPKLDQEQIDNASKRIIRQILGIDARVAGTFADTIRGDSRDNTIIKTREDVPLVLRNLMGEVKDSPVKMMLTLSAQAQFLARTQMLAEVSTNKQWVIPNEEKTKTGNEKFSVALNGAQWGPLEGMYATPKVAELLKEVVVPDAKWSHVLQLAATDTSEASKLLGSLLFSAWGKAANVTKGLTVVGNPFNYIWNIGGNAANLSRAGNFNPAYLNRAVKVAMELVASKHLRSVSDDTREVLRAGVSDSGQIGELTADKMAVLEDMIYKETSKTVADKVKTKLSNGATTAKEVYAMTDVVSKIANYLYYKDQLTSFYEAEKAGGVTVPSSDKIEREAADKVSDDNITFKRAMPLAKMLESRGLTMFAPYIAEVFRTQYNNLVSGYQELNRAKNATTPEGRMKMAEMGLRRLSGTVVAYTVLTAALASMAGGGDDDKKKAAKKFLPDYAQYGAPVLVGTDANGNPQYMTLNRVDPWGPLTDIMRAYQTGNIKDIDDAGQAILDLYVKPRMGYTVMKVLETQLNGDATSYDKRAALAKLGKLGLPAWFVNADTPNSVTGLGSSGYPQGGDMAPLGDAFKVLGGRLEVADIKKTLGLASKEFSSVQKQGRKELYQTLSQEDNMDTADFVTALQTAHEEEVKQFNNLVELDQALVTMGKLPKDRRTYWENAGLNRTVTELVMKGKNPSTFTTLLSKDSINRSWATDAGKLPQEELARTKDNIERNAAKLKQLGYTFN